MRKNRLLSVVLCAVFLFSAVFVPSTFAQTQGRITGDGVRIRAEATTNSDEIGKLDKGSVVTINSTASGTEAVSGGGTTWYNITSGDKTGTFTANTSRKSHRRRLTLILRQICLISPKATGRRFVKYIMCILTGCLRQTR